MLCAGKPITLRSAVKKESGFFSLFRSAPKTPDAPEVQLSEKEKEEIIRSLELVDPKKAAGSGGDNKKKEEVLPPDYVVLELGFRLPKLGVHLLNATGQYILQLQSNNTQMVMTKYTGTPRIRTLTPPAATLSHWLQV